MGRARRVRLAALSTAAALLVAAAAVEVWVRGRWDERRGRPGFFLSDPVRGQRLAPGYDGWFAGVPVHINALGFRDPREYALEKPPGTIRILVLGDSVTFGHGARFETTYPYLLEQRLRHAWPDVAWQVWNLGVPGYATSQALAYLHEVGPRFAPDLVVVGVFVNDLVGNEPVASPTLARRARSAVQRVMQRWLYSYEFYKRVYLTARWRLLAREEDRLRLAHLVTEEMELARTDRPADLERQALTEVEVLPEAAVRAFTCPGQPAPDPRPAERLRARLAAGDPELAQWLAAVRGFQELARRGAYRLVFFLNMAPEICREADRFYDGGSLAVDEFLQEVLGDGVPVASSARAFLRHRPSQMPAAAGHSIGNANAVKADVLFAVIQREVLPDLLAAALAR